MERLVFAQCNGNDYFLAYHSDEIHLFQVNKDEDVTFETFENATLMDDRHWKSNERFDIDDPTNTYFKENSIIIAEITPSGIVIVDEGLYQERKEYYYQRSR